MAPTQNNRRQCGIKDCVPVATLSEKVDNLEKMGEKNIIVHESISAQLGKKISMTLFLWTTAFIIGALGSLFTITISFTSTMGSIKSDVAVIVAIMQEREKHNENHGGREKVYSMPELPKNTSK